MTFRKLIIRNTSGYVLESLEKDRIDSLIFRDQYKDALESIDRYCSRMPKNDKGEDKTTDNIFAFIGERGSGKTSCLISVMNSILDGTYDKRSYTNIASTRFTSIDIIDPSFLDDENNIIGLFIAKLYRKFTEAEDRGMGSQDREVRNAVLMAFMEAQKSYKYLFGGMEKDHDELDNLELLSVAVDLRQSLHNLVSVFNKYMGVPSGKLLIAIDDVDLHSECATAISEEIRRYLTLNNVVILISIKLSQLTVLKTQKYIEEYKSALGKDIVTLATIEKMSEHYVTKLLPYAHRIFMPDGEIYGDMVMAFEDKPGDMVLVSQCIPELIFEKTRYLFYNSSVQTSYIVPTNLRELCQIAQMLHEMHPYRDEKTTDENGDVHEIRYEYNKLKFKEYFTKTWVSNHFSKKTEREIALILDVKEVTQYNAVALKLIDNRFKDIIELLKRTDRNELISQIYARDNKTYNISLGDVIYVLRSVEPLLTEKEDMYFLFFIKSLYSMLLYEKYDKMTDGEDIVTGVTKSLVLKNDPFGGRKVYDYHKLVAGAFVTCGKYSGPLPLTKKGDIRSPRPINIRIFHQKLNDVLENWDLVPNNYVRMIEFFMLCISRPFDSQNKTSEDYIYPYYRTRNGLWYNADFTNPFAKNAVFDITAFLFNITRIEECYARFRRGKEFFNKIIATGKGSLFWDFASIALNRAPKGTKISDSLSYWMSYACIRNVEVLYDLMDSFNVEGNSDDMKVLQNFFDGVGKYRIDTYRRNPHGEPYNINFAFSIFVSNVLKDKNLEAVFMDIYDSGYNEGEVSEDDAFKEIDKKSACYGMRKGEGAKINLSETFIQRLRDKYKSRWGEATKKIFEETVGKLPERISRTDMEQAVEDFNNKVKEMKQQLIAKDKV